MKHRRDRVFGRVENFSLCNPNRTVNSGLGQSQHKTNSGASLPSIKLRNKNMNCILVLVLLFPTLGQLAAPVAPVDGTNDPSYFLLTTALLLSMLALLHWTSKSSQPANGCNPQAPRPRAPSQGRTSHTRSTAGPCCPGQTSAPPGT